MAVGGSVAAGNGAGLRIMGKPPEEATNHARSGYCIVNCTMGGSDLHVSTVWDYGWRDIVAPPRSRSAAGGEAMRHIVVAIDYRTR